MPVRKYKPTTPGRRGSSVASFGEVTRAKPAGESDGSRSATGDEEDES